MTCEKLTYDQLVASATKRHKLEPVGKILLEAGLISQAELEVAKALKQRFYSPRRQRFANVQPRPNGDTEVVWLEPMKLPRATSRGRRNRHD